MRAQLIGKPVLKKKERLHATKPMRIKHRRFRDRRMKLRTFSHPTHYEKESSSSDANSTIKNSSRQGDQSNDDELSRILKEIGSSEDKWHKEGLLLRYKVLLEASQKASQKEEKEQLEWENSPWPMFGPRGSPRPTVIHRVPSGSFVNRKKELTFAWKNLITTFESANTTGKHHLLVTGQMFGSGKTALGKNLLNFRDVHVEAEYAKLPESVGKKVLRSAVPILIDLQQQTCPSFIETLTDYISWIIWTSTLETCFDIRSSKSTTFWMKQKYSPRFCVQELTELVGKPLFLHFDEINVIENENFIKFFPGVDTDDEYKRQLRKYYKVWAELYPLYKEGVFIYITGKSFLLSNMGFKQLGQGFSAGPVDHLFLKSLARSDIYEIFHARVSAMQSVDDEDVEKFTDWIYEWTSGIPRPVVCAIDAIIQTSPESSGVNFIMMNDSKCVDEIITLLSSLPDFPDWDSIANSTAEARHALEQVLLAGATNLYYNLSKPLPGVEGCTLQQLVDRFSIYVTPDDKSLSTGLVKIVLPKVWIKKLKFSNFPDFRQLAGLDSSLVSKGDALETVVQKIIQVRCSFKYQCTVKEAFPFLSETCLKNVVISENIKTYLSDKRISKKSAPKYDVRFLQEEGLVLYRTAPKSAHADVILSFPHTSNVSPRGICGFQCKNYPNSVLTTSVVQEEIDKFANLMEGSRGGFEGSAGNNAVLVIVLNGGRGDAHVEKHRGKILTSESGRAFNIPAGLELVILSKVEVTDFLGAPLATTLLGF